MSVSPLPPPIIVRPDDANPTDTVGVTEIVVSTAKGSDRLRARAFGAVLAKARSARGIDAKRIEIFAGDDPHHLPPRRKNRTWVPHLFSWQTAGNVALAWELGAPPHSGDPTDVSPEEIARWAERPDLLLRLGKLAARSAVPDRETGEHLSFRWLMANQEVAALALADETAVIEHVSLHVVAADEDATARLLTEVIGLIEIPRPPTISVPGRWLQAGNCRIHLNSREARDGELGFPGTAPNHVCFAVKDLPAVEQALTRQGHEATVAGSLEQRQVWLRLPGGSVIELQPRS